MAPHSIAAALKPVTEEPAWSESSLRIAGCDDEVYCGQQYTDRRRDGHRLDDCWKAVRTRRPHPTGPGGQSVGLLD